MTQPTRPNIVFIVADDLGYADLGCYGGRDASFGPVSPVLDGLAAQFVGRQARQGSVERADRRAGGRGNDDVGHDWFFSLEGLRRSMRPGGVWLQASEP